MLGQKVDTPMRGAFRGLFTLRGFLKYGTIAIALIVVLAIIYFNTQMRPHDLVSMFQSDQTPVEGLLVRYDSDQNRSELELTDPGMVEPVWQAMESAQVRYMQHISSAAVPTGGFYYEIMLSSQEDKDSDTHTYAFSCNTSGETVVKGMTYKLVDETQMIQALDAVFTQYEDRVTPVS